MPGPTTFPDNHGTAVRPVFRLGAIITRFSRGLDFGYTRALNGMSNGVILAGEPASPTMRFSGDLGPLQSFRGASPHAITRGLLETPNTALPSSGGVMRTGGASLLAPMADSQLGTS